MMAIFKFSIFKWYPHCAHISECHLHHRVCQFFSTVEYKWNGKIKHWNVVELFEVEKKLSAGDRVNKARWRLNVQSEYPSVIFFSYPISISLAGCHMYMYNTARKILINEIIGFSNPIRVSDFHFCVFCMHICSLKGRKDSDAVTYIITYITMIKRSVSV